jgi:hypothetical protein
MGMGFSFYSETDLKNKPLSSRLTAPQFSYGLLKPLNIHPLQTARGRTVKAESTEGRR